MNLYYHNIGEIQLSIRASGEIKGNKKMVYFVRFFFFFIFFYLEVEREGLLLRRKVGVMRIMSLLSILLLPQA